MEGPLVFLLVPQYLRACDVEGHHHHLTVYQGLSQFLWMEAKEARVLGARILSALISASRRALHAGVCLPVTFSHPAQKGEGPHLISLFSVIYSCRVEAFASLGNSLKGTSVTARSSGFGSRNKA